MECFGTTDFDNSSRLITLSAIIISGLHCTVNLKMAATPADPRYLKSPFLGKKKFAADSNRRCQSRTGRRSKLQSADDDGSLTGLAKTVRLLYMRSELQSSRPHNNYYRSDYPYLQARSWTTLISKIYIFLKQT